MECPSCGSLGSSVVDSRYKSESKQKRRKRKCKSCGKAFMTLEQLEVSPIQRVRVIKRDGRREAFSSEKLRKGVQLAIAKRPISTERVDYLVQDVGRRLVKTGRAEFETNYIGEMVMRLLIRLDRVAYIRFASVYRNFREVGLFRRTIEHAEKGAHPKAPDAQGRFPFAEPQPESNRPVLGKGRSGKRKSKRTKSSKSKPRGAKT